MGMQGAHAFAAGMGGMRTAGDLVARMQMTRGMRLKDAKEYVAGKLGVSVMDLHDPLTMTERRGELQIGRIVDQDAFYAGEANAIEAKFRIADVLDVPINCVERFKDHAGWAAGRAQARPAAPLA